MLSSLYTKMHCWWCLTSKERLISAESELLAEQGLQSCKFNIAGMEGCKLRAVKLGGPEGTEDLPPIVLLHGFGMGLAFWGKQLMEFRKHRQVIAVDLPGSGTSESWDRIPDLIDEVEDYFISTLESWREGMAIRRMVLVGHGFGAFVAAVYSLRHPKRVDQLILVSPVGKERRGKDEVPLHFAF